MRSLISERVDAVVAFWNAEGVALRRSGIPTREFRVSDHGAPPYPELVLTARRGTVDRDPQLISKTVAALEQGARAALADRPAAVAELAERSGQEPKLTSQQLDATAPALKPPLRFDRRALEGFAAFDLRFGVIDRPLDVERAFDLR